MASLFVILLILRIGKREGSTLRQCVAPRRSYFLFMILSVMVIHSSPHHLYYYFCYGLFICYFTQLQVAQNWWAPNTKNPYSGKTEGCPAGKRTYEGSFPTGKGRMGTNTKSTHESTMWTRRALLWFHVPGTLMFFGPKSSQPNLAKFCSICNKLKQAR